MSRYIKSQPTKEYEWFDIYDKERNIIVATISIQLINAEKMADNFIRALDLVHYVENNI